jgi:S1-C subfamily serine protease
MYDNGLGVTQDYTEAAKWFRKAAEQGYALAQDHLEALEAKIAAASTQSGERERQAAEAKRITKAQQIALERLDLYDGPIDGIAGPKTNQALKRWQTSRGYTGELSDQQTAELIDTAERYAAKRKQEERQTAKTQPQQEEPPTSFGTGSTGSGFFVSKLGHVVTNEHVVRNCGSVTVGDNANKQVSATVLETDKRNDLALLKLSSIAMASANTKSLIQKLGLRIVPLSSNGLLRSDDVELGERLMVGGYPYGDIFSNTIKVTGGMVSAIRGMGDDSGQFQMDAAVQPGNSGGPIYDENGNIVGVVVSQLDPLKVAKAIGSLPQNVNFGIKASTVRQFLVSSGLPTKWSDRSERMSSRDIAKIAKNQTVMVVCGP